MDGIMNVYWRGGREGGWGWKLWTTTFEYGEYVWCMCGKWYYTRTQRVRRRRGREVRSETPWYLPKFGDSKSDHILLRKREKEGEGRGRRQTTKHTFFSMCFINLNEWTQGPIEWNTEWWVSEWAREERETKVPTYSSLYLLHSSASPILMEEWPRSGSMTDNGDPIRCESRIIHHHKTLLLLASLPSSPSLPFSSLLFSSIASYLMLFNRCITIPPPVGWSKWPKTAETCWCEWGYAREGEGSDEGRQQEEMRGGGQQKRQEEDERETRSHTLTYMYSGRASWSSQLFILLAGSVAEGIF